MFLFFTMLVFFRILVSVIAAMSREIIVVLSKYFRASKFLFKDQVLK